jgi:hypothetical protein
MIKCTNAHRPWSARADKRLPPRVLGVSNPSLVRLVDIFSVQTTQTSSSLTPGTPIRSVKTENGNMKVHKREIAEASLPANFRDAIVVTQNLVIPYLWIEPCRSHRRGADHPLRAQYLTIWPRLQCLRCRRHCGPVPLWKASSNRSTEQHYLFYIILSHSTSIILSLEPCIIVTFKFVAATLLI